MKKLLRKLIREQINSFFEADTSAAASNTMGMQQGMVTPGKDDSAADTIANYEELKNQQLAQIDSLNDTVVKEKLKQKVNLDKIKKLMLTFSQVQDNDLATIPGGKSEDNKIKKMKQVSYLQNKKDIEKEIATSEEQIKAAEESVKNIENMIKQAASKPKAADTPTTPSTPSAP